MVEQKILVNARIVSALNSIFNEIETLKVYAHFKLTTRYSVFEFCDVTLGFTMCHKTHYLVYLNNCKKNFPGSSW